MNSCFGFFFSVSILKYLSSVYRSRPNGYWYCRRDMRVSRCIGYSWVLVLDFGLSTGVFFSILIMAICYFEFRGDLHRGTYLGFQIPRFLSNGMCVLHCIQYFDRPCRFSLVFQSLRAFLLSLPREVSPSKVSAERKCT